MFNENMLLDDFTLTGSNLEELKDIIKENEASQSFISCNSKDVSILTFKKEENDTLYFYRFGNGKIPTEEENRTISSYEASTPVSTILSHGDFDSLINEMTANNQTLMLIDGKAMFTSMNIMSTMQRFGLGGDFLTDPDADTGYLERNLIIAKRFKNNYPCTLCTKTVNGITKLFSINSGKYCPIKQDFIFEIIKRFEKDGTMGTPECRQWEFSHFYTSVYIEFPEKAAEISTMYKGTAKYIPGVYMCTSDTGNSSAIIRGTWRLDGSSSVSHFGEVAAKHMGKVDINKIYSDVESSIFAEYSKLPTTLCDLLTKDITDPSLDLTTTAGQNENREMVHTALKNVFKQINLVKVVGKKSEIAIRAQILSELDFTRPYTAYDIVDAVMSIPARAKCSSRAVNNKLSKECGRAPYLDFDAISSTSSTISVSLSAV